MQTKTIDQSVELELAPDLVYDILMDEKQHAKVIGEAVTMSKEVGGSFTVFGDYAMGKNIELVPGEKIVQSWRASDWPEGHYSTATFAFSPTPEGTKLTFTQTSVPEEFAQSIADGWNEYYWKPLVDYSQAK